MRTYGTVEYNQDAKAWIVKAEPHVSLRLKRVFGKVGKHSVGSHVISDTPETAEDLKWFMQRFPLDVKCADRLDAQSARYREGASVIERILEGRYDPPSGRELAVPPREYQNIAASMVLARRGMLLADDVGLGKTCSSICVLADPRTLPAVVVTLTHLPRQWVAELNRFAPWLNVHIVKKATPYDIAEARRKNRKHTMNMFSGLPDVLVINYHKLAGWAETIANLGFKAVIYDECQELRRTSSDKYAAARVISNSVEFRCGLSATPIYNYGTEFFSVIECLCPGELGTREEFHTEWCGGRTDERAPIKSPKAFGAYLRESGIMLRRTRSDVGRELPGIQKVPYVVDTDSAALDKVSGACAELARIILADAGVERGVKMRASEELSNTLRQATGIAKAPFVAEFVRLLIESGEKVVLYAWHHAVYDILKERLGDLAPALYTGSESLAQKEESKRRFIDGETPIFIISLRSGAGLDGLQKVCRTVVFGELDWSPGVHEQNEGRVNRDGQKDPVIAYYLIAEEGSDPIVSQVLGIKKQQIEGVRRNPSDETGVVEKLQMDGSHIKKLAEDYLASRHQSV